MRRVLKNIEAGEVPDALRRLGIQPKQRLRVIVETATEDDPPVTAMNANGGSFEWLKDEPELYSDSDLVEPNRP